MAKFSCYWAINAATAKMLCTKILIISRNSITRHFLALSWNKMTKKEHSFSASPFSFSKIDLTKSLTHPSFFSRTYALTHLDTLKAESWAKGESVLEKLIILMKKKSVFLLIHVQLRRWPSGWLHTQIYSQRVCPDYFWQSFVSFS